MQAVCNIFQKMSGYVSCLDYHQSLITKDHSLPLPKAHQNMLIIVVLWAVRQTPKHIFLFWYRYSMILRNVLEFSYIIVPSFCSLIDAVLIEYMTD